MSASILKRSLMQPNCVARIQHRHLCTDFQGYLTDTHFEQCVQKFGSFKGLKEWQAIKKRASVLIPVCLHNDEICLLYTQRTKELRRHSGQISFPGGMKDENESAVETAVRETQEEIGIPPRNIKVYGCGTPVGRLDVLITPVVGYVGSIVPSELSINRQEVEHAFALPMRKFCDLNNCRYTNFENKYTLPVFTIDGYRIWGITAYITHLFLKCFLENEYKFELKKNL